MPPRSQIHHEGVVARCDLNETHAIHQRIEARGLRVHAQRGPQLPELGYAPLQERRVLGPRNEVEIDIFQRLLVLQSFN